MAFLEVCHLGKTFTTPGGYENQALKDVSFELEKGEILSIVGHNGSGKTTLLNCIRQLFPWDNGDIRVDGGSMKTQPAKVVSVFQDIFQGVVPSMTPMENLALVFSGERLFPFSFPKKRYKSAITDFLEKSQLADRVRTFHETPVSDLSGGQRQQLAVIMAMMRAPKILLLDEFVASLDKETKAEILLWTKAWIRQHNITTLMVTHDWTVAEVWGDKVLELSDGQVQRFVRSNGKLS